MEKKLRNGEQSEFAFKQKAIKALAEILNQSHLTEIEYTCGEITIRVVKDIARDIAKHAAKHVTAEKGALVNSALHLSTLDQQQHEPVIGKEAIITAPVVGKIYIAPKPGGQPFVKVGDEVKAGDVIFIIEAMKVMNDVKADKSGIVKEIFVHDGQPVEYGQNLLGLYHEQLP